MDIGVSHDRQEESLEAKARWFQSLSVTERMDVFCSLTNLILACNPSVAEKKDARSVPGRIRVVEKT